MSHEAKRAAVSPAEKRMYQGTFVLIIFAESMVFVTIFASRFLYSGTANPLGLGWLPFAILASLALAWYFAWAGLVWLRADNRARSSQAQGWGAAVGLLALGLLLADLVRVGLSPENPFGSHYYLGEALHILHVFAGWLALLALWSKTRLGGLSSQNTWVLEAAIQFWGFVTLVWVAFVVVFMLL